MFNSYCVELMINRHWINHYPVLTIQITVSAGYIVIDLVDLDLVIHLLNSCVFGQETLLLLSPYSVKSVN